MSWLVSLLHTSIIKNNSGCPTDVALCSVCPVSAVLTFMISVRRTAAIVNVNWIHTGHINHLHTNTHLSSYILLEKSTTREHRWTYYKSKFSNIEIKDTSGINRNVCLTLNQYIEYIRGILLS